MTAVRPPLYYCLAMRLLAPIYRMMVKKKSRHRSTLSRELAERFGEQYLPVPKTDKGVIWCHAVSLGELNTAYPLLKKLLDAGFGLWISSTTQTGFERASRLFAGEIEQSRVSHSFVPVDTLPVIERFMAHVNPVVVLFIETELWANTLYTCKTRGIASLMINARLSEKSYQGYAKFTKLSQSMMANLDKIIAQDGDSAKRFLALGASDTQVVVIDSLKWVSQSSLTPANQQLAQTTADVIHTAGSRAVWTMASTHDGEERLALLAHQGLIAHPKLNHALLILVPRHPERFDTVYQLCLEMGLVTARRSANDAITAQTQVYLADTMGELMAWYQLCDVAVVGGSFVPVGGHNPIEPASLGKPIIMGSYDDNCHLLTKELRKVGALAQLDATDAQVVDKLAEALVQTYIYRWSGEQGKQLVNAKQSALTHQLEQIISVLHHTQDGRGL
ncbi:3-deoxy-D-manno-octulosonic acid transferase [Moraxella porci DSM 25326]|uniref:3-deoxy-D-manno-octulosonic acid transferase n=1 Tax=Moraxella porci DSM 25326 TaxID=573983 RepID=A0A1T0CVI9_9GAMM|nr:3-deoxy-D-manno-octulosonic acid transferase [Moraxella porci]OOS26337.1 3-deoxy-D-manno-octulosonic acid transferase [Moraxella porci DSM 25326]